MALPKGFNPKTMKMEPVQQVIEIPRNDSISSGYNYHMSFYERFDNFIGTIGNWIADKSENITFVIVIILGIGMGLGFLGWLISLGWFWGIVAGIFLGGIVYYITMALIYVYAFILNVALYALRGIFYSGKSFLITLGVIAVLGTVGAIRSQSKSSYESSPVRMEVTAPVTTKYRCTARVLNVRSQPSSNGPIIGSIKQNDVVDVYETYNGFAKIKYGSQDGYASLQYLELH